MKNYFKDCRTAEDCKRVYHQHAKQFHSDNTGGNDDLMKELNRQYTEAWNRLKDIHEYKDSTTGESKTYTSKQCTNETPEMFIEIVRKLSTIPDIEVEMVGTWLWISGNTYPYRDTLKEFGCRWSAGKKKWYWTTEPFSKKSSKLSMNSIRMRYGSEMLNIERTPELTSR